MATADDAPPPARRKGRISLRAALRAVHRDLGYACVGLVVAYAVSGIAVNHIEDWNPNYRYATRAVDVGPLPAAPAAAEAHVVASLALDRGEVRGHFQESDTVFRVFLADGQEVHLDRATGAGTFKGLSRRAVLFEVNALHLNTLKGAWTYVADAFAVGLLVLALSGLFLNKGRLGLAGRGKWYLLGGLAIPAAAVAYLYA